MIHIDRNRIPAPKELDPTQNRSLAKELELAQAYFREQEYNRKQKRFRFRAFMQREVKDALKALFHDKCAYCESKVGHVGPADIEHFRPKSKVLEAPDHPGYWWLASDWDNLLLACNTCNRKSRTRGGMSGKANRFPLEDESQRALSPETPLSQEAPLLLDPCRDQPENHFTYNDDGTMISPTERGKTTIMVIGLNRDDLVTRRREAIVQINSKIDFLVDLAEGLGLDMQMLQDMTREEEEFAGLKRQYVRAALERIDKKKADQDNLRYTKVYTQNEKQQIRDDYNTYQTRVRNIKLKDSMDESEVQSRDYTFQERFVEKLELENVRTFQQQAFNFVDSEGESAPWLMLLGENGTGKSTILKSLCMNLCDADYFQDLVRADLVNPNSFIRRGEQKAVIKVWVTGSDEPRMLEFEKDQVKFTNTEGASMTLQLPLGKNNQSSDVWSSDNFLLAFGATRLLPRGSKHEAKHIKSRFSRLDNLFNPFVPLVNAEKWLLDLEPVQFHRVAIILKDLLRMSEDEDLPTPEGEVIIPMNGLLVPINELSDGYQSVIALTIDILQLVMTRWRDPDEARGIVLLDEVGAHLHPRWKMQIVGSLRKALPNMQFIVSTHQPLCLRGIGKGEIVLLRRDEDRNIEVITKLPNPKELRISQLLTSIFGLRSTVDPELEEEYNRYYELRAQHERTEEEEEEMKRLQAELNPDMLVGETLVDNLVYSAIQEKYNEYQQEKNLDNLRQLKEDTLSAVQKLWKS